MVRKYTLIEKRKWLEDYEKGYSEPEIAKKYQCNIRTVQSGLEKARQDTEARAARIEVLKTAYTQHQEKLKHKLEETLTSLTPPTRDWAVLSWNQGNDSIFNSSEFENLCEPVLQSDLHYELLMEHLKNEKLAALLAAWGKAYTAHQRARIELQMKVVSILENATGLPLTDRPDEEKRFLYSYNAGDLFYRKVIAWAFGDKDTDWLNDIIPVPEEGNVRYQGNILADASANEKECRESLVKAFGEIQNVTEAVKLKNTHLTLEAAAVKARRAIEEVLALGVIMGRCRVCKKLG